jgi:hypothetical protein
MSDRSFDLLKGAVDDAIEALAMISSSQQVA